MNIKTLLLISLAAALSFAAPAQQENSELDPINMSAYLSLMDGDRAMRENKVNEAKGFYEKALEYYTQLKSLNPEYKAMIVEVRIGDLSEKLEELKNTTPGTATAASRNQKSSDYKLLYIEAKEEAVALSSRLLKLEKNNIAQERTLRERELTIDEQRRELVTLRRKISELDTGLGNSLKRLERDLDDSKSYNKLLQERHDELNTKVAASAQALTEQKTAYESRNQELQKLRADFADALDAKDQFAKDLELSKTSSAQQTATQNKALEALNADLSTAETLLKEHQTAVEAAAIRETELSKQIETLRQQTNAATAAATQKEAALTAERDQLKQQVEAGNGKHSEEIAKLNQSLKAQHDAAAKALSDQLAAKSAEAQDLKQQVNALQQAQVAALDEQKLSLQEQQKAADAATQKKLAEKSAEVMNIQKQNTELQNQLVTQAESFNELNQALENEKKATAAEKVKVNTAAADLQKLREELKALDAISSITNQYEQQIQNLNLALKQKDDASKKERGATQAQMDQLLTDLNGMTALKVELDQLNAAGKIQSAATATLEKKIEEQKTLIQRLTQDADFSRGEMEQLLKQQKSIQDERIELLAAMQEKDEDIITATTATSEQGMEIQKLQSNLKTHTDLVSFLTKLAPKDGKLVLTSGKDQKLEFTLPTTPNENLSFRRVN